MEDQHYLLEKTQLIHSISRQTCKTTQAGGLQNRSSQNLKNDNSQNSGECLKLSEKPRVYFCTAENITQGKIQNLEGVQQNIKSFKKPINTQGSNGQFWVKNEQKMASENCKKQQGLLDQKQDCPFGQNNQGLKRFKNENYNNQEQYKCSEKFKFKQSQKIESENPKQISQGQFQIPTHMILGSLQTYQLSMAVGDAEVVDPIPDSVLKDSQPDKLYADFMKSGKHHALPKAFSFILEILNLTYLLPQIFQFNQETAFKLMQMHQAQLQSKNNQQIQEVTQKELDTLLSQLFINQLKSISCLMIQDLTSQKLQLLTDTKAYNILSLAKFCHQNELLQFVFKYNWPIIVLQLAKLSNQQLDTNHPRYKQSILFLNNSIIHAHCQTPDNLHLTFQIISFLLDSFSKTNMFRDLLNKKIQSNRNVSKKNNEIQQEKRALQLLIKKIKNTRLKKSKKIVKKQKIKTQHNHEDGADEKQNGEKQDGHDQLSKLQKQLEQVKYQFQKQSHQDSLSCSYFLGKDKNNLLYWYISYFPDKLFIEKSQCDWDYISAGFVYVFAESLDKKVINQNRLYSRIQQFYRHSILTEHPTNQVESDENCTQKRPMNSLITSTTIGQRNISYQCQNVQMYQQKLVAQQNCPQYDSSGNSMEDDELLIGFGVFRADKDSLFRMVQVGESKMTEYLKDRNSRWGSQDNKQLLFSTIKGSQPNWFEEVKKLISNFNQRICVVEIQYKVFVQQFIQPFDSKVKKIQTKIWGINQKYKHNWYHLINSCQNLAQLFFAVSVLYNLIRKYTSKHRKLRKEYEQIKLKTVWMNTPANMQRKNTWSQTCQVCGLAGQVLCCDFCPKVYHLECIEIKQIPSEQYECKSCKQRITTRNQLKSLNNTSKNTKNELHIYFK